MTGDFLMARYSLLQRLLHWLIAVIVIAVLVGGFLIDEFGFKGLVESFGQDMTNLIYKYHKTFGVVILGAMVVRLIVKVMRGKPAYDQPLSSFEARASSAVHVLFYVRLFLMPILGWLATAAGGFPVEFFNWTLPGLLGVDKELSETLYYLHGVVGSIIAVLVLVHIAGVIKHVFVNKDQLLPRML